MLLRPSANISWVASTARPPAGNIIRTTSITQRLSRIFKVACEKALQIAMFSNTANKGITMVPVPNVPHISRNEYVRFPTRALCQQYAHTENPECCVPQPCFGEMLHQLRAHLDEVGARGTQTQDVLQLRRCNDDGCGRCEPNRYWTGNKMAAMAVGPIAESLQLPNMAYTKQPMNDEYRPNSAGKPAMLA
ncbi:hypothetical protein B566_EDAN003730 [Ephemera danica]|nr:hypothetical protein B566_EDAN003730 [Ephemera danica]